MKILLKKSVSAILVTMMFLNIIGIVTSDINIIIEAKAEEILDYNVTYDKIIKMTDENNPVIYSYTASENKTIEVLGNVWANAILHIEAYSDTSLNNLIAENYTIVPNGEWASASTPHIYLTIEAGETVYIKAYADNPQDPTLDLNNIKIVVAVHDCIDLSEAEIIPPVSIEKYGWNIFKDAFNVSLNGEWVSPAKYEIVCDGKNVEGEYLSPGKHIITVRGIGSAIGSRDIEIEVKPQYICLDCKKPFITESEYQNHLIEETARKEYENACLNAQIEIREPSATTISYGDSIILHADLTALPTKWKIVWSSDNYNFSYSPSSDARTCIISPVLSGITTFTVTVYDENETVISSDTQEMTSKAGFWDKIIAFFKSLFGVSKIIPQTSKNPF